MKTNRSQIVAWFAIACAAGAGALAQPGAPPSSGLARLALVAEVPPAVAALDLLTVELSNRKGIVLLERSEIDRIYREQALSAANKDYLKLGHVLGADGLWLLNKLSEGTNQFLQMRLIAVKPGVIVASVRQQWPATAT